MVYIKIYTVSSARRTTAMEDRRSLRSGQARLICRIGPLAKAASFRPVQANAEYCEHDRKDNCPVPNAERANEEVRRVHDGIIS